MQDTARTLASALGSLKALGLAERSLFNEILRSTLLRHPDLLGVWTVWEPDALDARDGEFANKPGHDDTGRFVPLWNRYGGDIRLEPNTSYDKPGANHWYWAPTHLREAVVIDPYEYPMAGRTLFITSHAAPVFHQGKCVGVTGIDILLDQLLTPDHTAGKAALEEDLNRGHILLSAHGEMKCGSPMARGLLRKYFGSGRRLSDPVRDFIQSVILSSHTQKGRSKWKIPGGERSIRLSITPHPHTAGFVLVVEEEAEATLAGSSANAMLSPREREVMEWIGHGKSNEEIGIILEISPHTVKNHIEKIFRKLGVENRHAAAVAVNGMRHSSGQFAAA